MKKLFLLSLLLIPFFCLGQIGWSNLSSNQWVSFQDAQGSGISTKQSLPPNARWMDKTDCGNYLNLDMTKLSGYAQNQFVTKIDLINASVEPSAYYQYIVSYQTFSDRYAPCQNTGTEGDTIYSADFPLHTNSRLYEDPGLVYPYNSYLTTLAFHPSGYLNDYFSIGDGSTKSKLGESFIIQADYTITKAQFYLMKIGSPTGSITAKIYATTGMEDKICTGSALAISSNVDVSALNSDNYELVDFNFPGIALSAGECYAVILEYPGGSTGNAVVAGIDLTAQHIGGNMISQVNGDETWYPDAYDMVFTIYGHETSQWRWAYLSTNPSTVYSYQGVALGNTVTDITTCGSVNITLDPVDLYPGSLDGDVYVSYTADNNTYIITPSDDSWISVTGGIAEGSGSFYVHVDQNSTGETRTGNVSITVNGTEVKRINIIQGY
jgi:hypothetical protein